LGWIELGDSVHVICRNSRSHHLWHALCQDPLSYVNDSFIIYCADPSLPSPATICR
jgi:hypothetical protein